MTLHLAKAQPGQDFPDLDLTTSLLQPVGAYDPTGSTAAGGAGGGAAACEPPRIEVLRSEEYMPSPSSSSPSPAEGEGASAAAAAAAASDEKRETQPQPGSAAASAEGLLPTLAGIAGVRPPRYGFNRAYAGVFRHLRDEMAEVLRVPDPEGTPEGIRTLVRALT